jgi:hypothetical protein
MDRLKTPWVLYLGIGTCFSAIMELGAIWASWAIIWHLGLIHGFLPAVLALFIAHFGIVLRMVSWLPALAIWAFTNNGYSFGEWLAPGFFIQFGG